MADENKTERVQLLMTPSELKAIDDWSFENRIRGRAEAIRRLCEIGLDVHSKSGSFHQSLDETFFHLTGQISRMIKLLDKNDPESNTMITSMIDVAEEMKNIINYFHLIDYKYKLSTASWNENVTLREIEKVILSMVKNIKEI